MAQNICLRNFNWDYKKTLLQWILSMDFIDKVFKVLPKLWRLVKMHSYKNWLVSTRKKLSLKKNFKLIKTFGLKQLIIKASWVFKYSPFRLRSLIYMENFKFENTAIMEDKQCEQTEWFSVIAKGSDYFLSLDGGTALIIQRYGPYQMKKENFRAILVNFHQRRTYLL